MRYVLLFLVFLSCGVNEELEDTDKARFEGSWWELDCSFGECPFCFGLSLEEDEVYTWYPNHGLYQQGYWTFEEPNVYIWEDGEQSYDVKIVEHGDCFKLHMGLLVEEVCECTLLPEGFRDPLL